MIILEVKFIKFFFKMVKSLDENKKRETYIQYVKKKRNSIHLKQNQV